MGGVVWLGRTPTLPLQGPALNNGSRHEGALNDGRHPQHPSLASRDSSKGKLLGPRKASAPKGAVGQGSQVG